MNDLSDRSGIGACQLQQLAQSLQYSLGRIMRRRKRLEDREIASHIVDQQEIGERAADIDPNSDWVRRPLYLIRQQDSQSNVSPRQNCIRLPQAAVGAWHHMQ